MNPLKEIHPGINHAATLRLRLRKVMTDSERLDVPPPPRPPPPMWRPTVPRDTIYNPMELNWETLLPDLNILEGVFAESTWDKVRFISAMEHQISRSWGSALRRKYPLPCELPGSLALVADRNNRIQSSSRANHSEYTYLTTAPYPEWLADPVQRGEAFVDAFMLGVGL